MKRKDMQALIDKLERKNREALDEKRHFFKDNYEKTVRIEGLEGEILAEKEKYAALLERYISMMERMTGLKAEEGEQNDGTEKHK